MWRQHHNATLRETHVLPIHAPPPSLTAVRGLSVHRRVAVTVILVLVLAVRSLLPAGFMLQASDASSGKLEVVICTSAGIKHLTLDEGGTPVAPAKSQHLDHGLCPYAGAGALAVTSADSVSLFSQVEYAAVTYVLAVAQFAETPQPGATSARGPPIELI